MQNNISENCLKTGHFARTFVIAEAGVNHNGDFDTAIKLIDAAKIAGADAVKFQTFKAHECTNPNSPLAEYQEKNSQEITNQFDLLKSLELDFADFDKLKSYAEEKGLIFLSTPDGLESLHKLEQIKVSAIKIGSGELNNKLFLSQIGKTGLPVILSTGMGTIGEVQNAIEILSNSGAGKLHLLHCTTGYPITESEANLRVITTLQQAFQLPTGYSDHTLGIEAAIAAVSLGAKIIEKHLTLDKSMHGPDHLASANPDEFQKMVSAIRKVEKMLGNPIKVPSESELEIVKSVRRSLCVNTSIKKGQAITADKLELKRPGTGISPEFYEIIIGRVAAKDLARNEVLTWSAIGGFSVANAD